MQRRALLVALVAAVAVLAFGLGAATLDDALSGATPLPEGGDAPAGNGSNATNAAASGPGADCSACGFGLGISISVSGLLPAIPAAVSVGIAVAGLLLLALLWYRAGGGTGAAPSDLGPGGDAVGVGEDGDGTGQIAIDEPAADNAVYRAWRTLVERVDDRDPSTTTPGEYAAAARERSLDAGAVETVTELFDRVRYGGASVTEERAERAEAAAERLPAERLPEEQLSEAQLSKDRRPTDQLPEEP